jgi:hypothetical protein
MGLGVSDLPSAARAAATAGGDATSIGPTSGYSLLTTRYSLLSLRYSGLRDRPYPLSIFALQLSPQTPE